MNQKVKKREASGASPAIQYTKHVKMLDSSCAAPRRGAASVAGQHFSETVSHPVGWLMSTVLKYSKSRWQQDRLSNIFF